MSVHTLHQGLTKQSYRATELSLVQQARGVVVSMLNTA